MSGGIISCVLTAIGKSASLALTPFATAERCPLGSPRRQRGKNTLLYPLDTASAGSATTRSGLAYPTCVRWTLCQRCLELLVAAGC
ncbi:hypothetical protein PF007_g11477 [Phytophthora fragariae]|uniref:Uncharacterized protein n=1 Tax=Phytophthora fragariae TaxID=53985 RepID=A0A6A3S7H6_9STRA|nr:hypothetical protein PF007_g11477 [Phytophthora fragariae]